MGDTRKQVMSISLIETRLCVSAGRSSSVSSMSDAKWVSFMIRVIHDEGERRMNNRQKVGLIAGISGGVAGGVALAVGVSLNLPTWQYVLIAMFIATVIAVLLNIILSLRTGE